MHLVEQGNMSVCMKFLLRFEDEPASSLVITPLFCLEHFFPTGNSFDWTGMSHCSWNVTMLSADNVKITSAQDTHSFWYLAQLYISNKYKLSFISRGLHQNRTEPGLNWNYLMKNREERGLWAESMGCRGQTRTRSRKYRRRTQILVISFREKKKSWKSSYCQEGTDRNWRKDAGLETSEYRSTSGWDLVFKSKAWFFYMFDIKAYFDTANVFDRI